MSTATRTDTRRRAARRRQPRPDPRARRAREQPQGRQRRDPEAPADGVHRRLRLGQELAGVRHDRRGVAAADQRDLQRLRAGLHADAGAARGRRARRADDRDHRRPGADGRRPPLHGRHRHRRQRDAAHPVQPARAAAHRLAPGVLLQRRLGQRRAARSPSSAAAGRRRSGAASARSAACARAARAGARSPTSTSPQLYDDSKSLNEGALTIPGYSMDGWYGRIFSGCGFFDPDKPIRKFTKKELHDLLYKEPTKIKVEGINLTYEGLIPKIQKSMLSKDVDALQPHIRAFVERAVTFTDLPRVRRHPAQRGRPGRRRSRASTSPTPARCRSATWPTGSAGSTSRRWRRCSTALQQTLDSFVEIGLGYLCARPAVGHAVGRRGAAHQDDPPPRVVAHRRHLRLRRADDRAAPARHRSG